MSQRSSRMTKVQKKSLIQFALRHPELANTSDWSLEQIELVEKLWVDCSAMLNTHGPPKSINQWKTCWSELKTNVKRKASKKKPFTNLEDKLHSLLNKSELVEEHNQEDTDVVEPVTEDLDKESTEVQNADSEDLDNDDDDEDKKIFQSNSVKERSSPEQSSPRPLPSPPDSPIPKKRIKIKNEFQDLLQQLGNTINMNHNIVDSLNSMAKALNSLANAINKSK